MRPLSMFASVLLGGALVLNFGSTSGCGGSAGSGDKNGGSSGGSGGAGSSSGSIFGDDGGSSSGSSSGGMAVCPSGLQCNVSCSGGGTTTISGIVYDPAGKDPLYNIAVYVPATPLQPLPAGVPTGADACDCAALFKSGAVVSTTTGVDGSFKLTNAPVGSSVPLVIQVGKWRRQFNIASDRLHGQRPGWQHALLTRHRGRRRHHHNMPDIAVSTGGADTLECLMRRIGLPTTEYVAGAGGTGHVHVFSGGDSGGGGGNVGGSRAAVDDGSARELPEPLGLAGAPHAIRHRASLVRGRRDVQRQPAALEAYLNAGGRAFGSHFHYAWFFGPDRISRQAYTAPADWGTNLATWTAGSNGGGAQSNGKIVQTLNGSTAPFAKGEALYQWLGLGRGARRARGARRSSCRSYQPRFNAVVGPSNKPSQPWVNDDKDHEHDVLLVRHARERACPAGRRGAGLLRARGLQRPARRRRDDDRRTSRAPPNGCTNADLSPQEKALEFMLFDLSSCVIPDTVAPPDGGISTLQ